MDQPDLNIKEFAEYLAEFFKDRPDKITFWWLTKNPMLGGTTPAYLYLMRPEKALRIFSSLVDESLPRHENKKQSPP